MKRILSLAIALGLILMVASPVASAADAAGDYKAKCQMCHGPDGKGTPVGTKMGAHDFHGADVQKMADGELASVIENGKNKMPAYKGKLTADQIKALAAYVKELGKK
ncbi:MAG TPA: cytochrome c [Terriglobales bacterium]|nr:cytochrome c [Terriglobales bacterium]